MPCAPSDHSPLRHDSPLSSLTPYTDTRHSRALSQTKCSALLHSTHPSHTTCPVLPTSTHPSVHLQPSSLTCKVPRAPAVHSPLTATLPHTPHDPLSLSPFAPHTQHTAPTNTTFTQHTQTLNSGTPHRSNTTHSHTQQMPTHRPHSPWPAASRRTPGQAHSHTNSHILTETGTNARASESGDVHTASLGQKFTTGTCTHREMHPNLHTSLF